MNTVPIRLAWLVVVVLALGLLASRVKKMQRPRTGPAVPAAAGPQFSAADVAAAEKRHARMVATCRALGPRGEGSCLHTVALEKREPALCERVAGTRGPCLEDVALAAGRAEWCPVPGDGTCHGAAARAGGGASACDAAPPEGKATCLALVRGTPEACLELPREHVAGCLRALALATRNAEACGMGPLAEAKVSRYVCLEQLGIRTGDATVCERIPHPGRQVDTMGTNAHEDCVAGAARTAAIGFPCDPMRQASCEGRQAFRTNDISVCTKGRGSQRDACLLVYAALDNRTAACPDIQDVPMRDACFQLPP